MAAAVIELRYFGASASEPAGASVETPNGMKYNRADTQAGTAPIPKPTATGTAFAWVKQLALVVTTTGTTTIGTLRIKLASALATGLTLGFLGSGTYADQTGGGAQGSDSGSNGAVPSGYAAVTTSYQTYDSATGISTGTTGRKGQFCRTALGVDNLYVGGAGNAISIPDVSCEYVEQ